MGVSGRRANGGSGTGRADPGAVDSGAPDSGAPGTRPGAAGVWRLLSALLVCLAAPAFFVAELLWLGAALLLAGLALALGIERRDAIPNRLLERGPGPEGRAGAAAGRPSLLRDLSLIALGLGIVRIIPLAAELDNAAMLRFGLALGGAVAVPYLVSRYVYRDRAIGFPWRSRRSPGGSGGAGDPGGAGGAGRGWSRAQWLWLVGVVVLAGLILPWYFISSGVYRNWPVVDSPDLIGRLFVGVGAVGIWDELFFICTVFALLLRHFPARLANVLQAVVFVSFLWELGYRAWGPVLTIPFALAQGFIFLRTRSLAYVVTVHLLFDAVVFAVIVYAHNR